MRQRQRNRADRGSVLPIVLVVVVVLGAVVVATAKYATSTLKYGQTVEGRADRLSAAEGGMRDIIDRIGNAQLPLCATAAGVGGVDVNLPDISGAQVTVRCQQVGGQLADITSWAVVVTGAGGVPDGQGLTTQSGGTKIFGGSTYVARPQLLGLQKDLRIEQGDLWYTDASCSAGGDYQGGATGHLVFDSPIRGRWCTNRPWQYTVGQPSGLFGMPAVPTLPTNLNPPYQDFSGCRVFSPGRYTTAPNWLTESHGGANYLKSGDYVFAIPGSGTIALDHATVTAGREGVGGDEQQIDNPLCDAQRDADTATGATLYLDGNTHIDISGQSSLEILRRQQGDNVVSIQTLPTHTANYTTAALSTKSGNTSQMAIHGMIWTPNAGLELGNVTNTVVAQILGGAVVARIDVDSSASADGLLIRVQGAPSSDKWALTSTATEHGAVTRVRVIAQVRHSSTDAGQTVWEVAQNSWRVCDPLSC